jgi:GTP1/Obg family GTP-binding protein
MESMLKQLHPALQTLLVDMVDVGLEEAQSRLEKKLMEATQEDQMKIMTDAQRMATIDQELQDNCGHLESIGNKYDNHEEFMNSILDQLKDLKDCTLTYKTMKLGLSGQK